MTTKESLLRADFEYAEFSGDIFCPFCNALLITKNSETQDDLTEDDVEELRKQLDDEFICKHVGFWFYDDIGEHTNCNDSWRSEMFTLTKVLKNELDDEYGSDWPEALNYALNENGNIGWAAAIALPTFQVAVYKQFFYVPGWPRVMSYAAVLLRKK